MSLKIKNLTVRFGGQTAVDDVSLDVPAGQITGLVGPNGSGKSTVMNAATGVLVPDRGSIHIKDKLLHPGRPGDTARAGLGRTFQIPRLARRLTVFQNLLAGARDQPGEQLFSLFFRPRRVADAERSIEKRAHAILKRIGLGAKLNTLAGELSGGQQKLLTMGMLLMSDCKVLLLDEPAAGVNPALIEEQILLLQSLRDEGRAILLVEHNMGMISRLCDSVCVLDSGIKIAHDDPETVQRDPRVIASYLSMQPEQAPAKSQEAHQ